MTKPGQDPGAASREDAGESAADDERARRKARRIDWAVRLGVPLVRLLAATWRIREVNRSPSQRLRDGGKPVVFTLWHGEMLALLWHHRGEGITVLISEHGDGEIIARIAEALGFRTVRGSTSRGGGRALLGMSRTVQGGGDVAFTPDGPRGPARRFAPGALIVAQRTGAPVITLAVSASRAWRLKSWDRFMIPKPFSRIRVAYGDPVYLDVASPREAAEQSARFDSLMESTGAAARA
ncbi:MAG TPA: lysophospholipid acyltransferase family protein [Gemmatimonadaceae bacterium]|nr:lysophospholipid acyltransferase family protein [Gemmatimonadaceae bacterium]